MAISGRIAFTSEDEHEVSELVLGYLNERQERDEVPLVVEMGPLLGVSDPTVKKYRKSMPWFRDLIDKVEQKQHAMLHRKTLDKDAHKGAVFLLAVSHKVIAPKVVNFEAGLDLTLLAKARRRAQGGGKK